MSQASTDVITPSSYTVYELRVDVEIEDTSHELYTNHSTSIRAGTVNSGKAYISGYKNILKIEHFAHRYTLEVGHLEEWYNRCK